MLLPFIRPATILYTNQVETALTPQDALEQFSANPKHFDVVITDMTMRQMTGVKLSEKVMEIREDIPIVPLSMKKRRKSWGWPPMS
jgi:DNA-binding NtrC family response regulator